MCNVNIRRCIEFSDYQVGMIIVEKRMTDEVIANPVLESSLEKNACSLLLLHACVSRKSGGGGSL